jgi:hypothetical protein
MLFSSDTSNALNVRIGQGNLSNVNGLSVGRNFNSDNENCAFTWEFNTWYHVAIVRASSVYYFFVNGVQQTTLGSGTSSYSFATASTVAIGDAPSYPNDEIYKGYISNARVSNVARYTSNFTPSTTPLTALSGTQFLSLQNNRWIDNSTNNSAITPNGTPSVQAFSPFAPTAAYDTAVVGGSGLFIRANSDNLTLPNNSFLVGSSDFSLETWAYQFDRSGSMNFFGNQTDRATAAGSSWNIAFTNSNGYLESTTWVGTTAYNLTSSVAPPLNAWNHIVWSRTGGTQSLFLNGTRVATRSDMGTLSVNNGSTSNPPAIGCNGGGAGDVLNGYLSGFKIIIGSGGYDATASTISVPTAPPTNTTNTKILANFTNSGIFDSTAKNDLQTIGNAQVSTTQAKWGTTSIYLDGSGDYLTRQNSNLYDFGTGEFTIEMWIYPTSVTGGDKVIMDTRASGSDTGYTPYITSGSKLAIYSGGADRITSSTSISANTWTHIAFVRYGTTLAIYLNGTRDVTATYSSAINCLGRVSIGCGFDNAANLPAYIDDLRITKGYARYSGASFTPPAAAFLLL